MKKKDSWLKRNLIPLIFGVIGGTAMLFITSPSPRKQNVAASQPKKIQSLGFAQAFDEAGRQYIAFIKADDKSLVCMYPGDTNQIVCGIDEYIGQYEKKFGRIQTDSALLELEYLCKERGLSADLEKVRALLAPRNISFSRIKKGEETFLAFKHLGTVEFIGRDENRYNIILLDTLEILCMRSGFNGADHKYISLKEAMLEYYYTAGQETFSSTMQYFADNMKKNGVARESIDMVKSLIESVPLENDPMPKLMGINMPPSLQLALQNPCRMV